MSVKSRIKKLEEQANVGFVVAVPEIEYFWLGEDCTGAIARWEDEFDYQSARAKEEAYQEFRERFTSECRDALKRFLGKSSATTVILDDHVRAL